MPNSLSDAAEDALKAAMPPDAIWLSGCGLWAGHTLLVEHRAPHKGMARLETMLATAFQNRLSPRLLESVKSAIEVSRQGDQALANIRLAVCGIPRLPAADDWPVRATAAKELLAKGVRTEWLLQWVVLGGVSQDELGKYDPNQPRVPPGSGRESGRWTNGSGATPTSPAAAPLAVPIIARGAPLLAPTLGAETLAALSALAATVGLAATLGVLFVPSPNATSSSGPLPGDTENTYSYDHDEGLLRILGPTGVVLAAGKKDSSGVFRDFDTSVPFARELDGALLFDSGPVQAVAGDRADADVGTDEDEPKLCPEPGPDQPGAGSASDRAQKYQEQISRMVNPQRPLDYGLAMNLVDPFTGKVVHYDECDEQTGTMIEAKGPGFDGLLSFPKGLENVSDDWVAQGTRELEAAGARQVVWYFAEDTAAEYARILFADYDLGKIIVRVQHPV